MTVCTFYIMYTCIFKKKHFKTVKNGSHIPVFSLYLFIKVICETSNFCSCKSCSNPFLEPTSTKQLGLSFLHKETTGTFDGAQD